MKPYQERIIEEKDQLDLKKDKLSVFVQSPYFVEMDDSEQRLLSLQLALMEEYSAVLGQRISLF